MSDVGVDTATGASVGTAIGGPVGGLIGGAGGAILGFLGQNSTNAANKEIAEMNIEYQKEVNARNEALMRENWGREDNAVQRRANDLALAGMSPLLAAGAAAGAGQVVSMKAPESHQVVQQSGMQGAISGIYQGIMQQQSMMDMMARQQQLIVNQQQYFLNSREQFNRDQIASAEAGRINLGTRGINLDNKLKEIGLNFEERIKMLQLLEMTQNYENNTYNYGMSKKYGLKTNETGNTITKTAQQLSQTLENIGSEFFGKGGH